MNDQTKNANYAGYVRITNGEHVCLVHHSLIQTVANKSLLGNDCDQTADEIGEQLADIARIVRTTEE